MDFLSPPWAHQVEAINRAMPLEEFGLFFEQGAGKSFSAVNIVRGKCALHKKLLRTLIVCPSIVVENWRREFAAFSKIKQVYTLTGSEKNRCKQFHKATRDGPAVLIVNFEGLRMVELFHLLLNWRPEIMVVDESQRIKDGTTITARQTIKLGDVSLYRYALTGTPILQSPMDLFSQFRFLDKGATFGKNFLVFRSQYFHDKNAGMPKDKYFPQWVPLPGLDAKFNELIYKKSMRVTKEECLDLPPFVRQQFFYDLAGDQLRCYKEMAKHFITMLNDKACVANLALTKGLRLQQITCGIFKDDEGHVTRFKNNGRLKALAEVLESIDISQHKVIVWASFRANYDDIGGLCEKLGIKYVTLAGGMTEKARVDAVDLFQGDNDTRILIGNQRACGLGINLTRASYAVYYSKNMRLEDDLQSEARNHRGGSEIHEKITRIDITARGSIDERITEILQTKADIASNILHYREKLKNILPDS